MCRYNLFEPVFGGYKTHWVCFPCRFTAKHWPRTGSRCPTCRALMVDLGRDFHPPRRTDDRQWRKVEMLAAANIRFDSCGCTGPGPRPRTLSDATSQLRRRRSDRRNRAAPPRKLVLR